MVAVAISVIPAFQRIGAPGVAALEQAGPKTIAVLGLAASFVAAVWPPSALHPSSSTFSLIGWPTSVPPWSLIAISAPALLVDAERRIGSGHHPIAADLDRCTLGDHKNADIISDRTLGFRGCHGRRAKRGQRGAKRGQQTLAVFHRRSSLLNLRAQPFVGAYQTGYSTRDPRSFPPRRRLCGDKSNIAGRPSTRRRPADRARDVRALSSAPIRRPGAAPNSLHAIRRRSCQRSGAGEGHAGGR